MKRRIGRVIGVFAFVTCIVFAAVSDGGRSAQGNIGNLRNSDAVSSGPPVQTQSEGLGTKEDGSDSGADEGADEPAEEFLLDAWVYEEVWNIWEECRQLEPGEDWKVPYADDETFAIIQAAYAKIDFGGEFETGEPEVYEEYRRKFWKLIQGEGMVADREAGEELSFSEFMERAFSTDGEEYVPENHDYTYYLFDMDGDGCPELGVREGYRPVYFLCYDEDKDKFYVWYRMNDYRPTGTGRGMYAFHLSGWDPEIWAYIRLDENAETECRTCLFRKSLSEKGYLNMVMLPVCADKDREVEVTKEMRDRGVYVRSDGQWFFRVTDNQYQELMGSYMEAYRKSNREKFEVQYSYEALFGDFMQTAPGEEGTVKDSERMTQREAVDTLLGYLYQDLEVVMEGDPPNYYFQLASDVREDPQGSGYVICLACEGLSADGSYYLFGFYTQLYDDPEARYEEDFYASSYLSGFAVNRETGEVIMEREQNEVTWLWEYSEEYERIKNME